MEDKLLEKSLKLYLEEHEYEVELELPTCECLSMHWDRRLPTTYIAMANC